MVTPESIQQNIEQGMTHSNSISKVKQGGDERTTKTVHSVRLGVSEEANAVSPMKWNWNHTYVSVSGNDQHFEAVVVSEEFAGKSRVQRHQRVYQTLGDRMRAEIHALSMKTFTPQEWQEQK